MALQKWRVLVIIDLLPIILRLSLYLFLISLITPLSDSTSDLASISLSALTVIGAVFFLITLVIMAYQPGHPFQTPTSVLLLQLLQWIRKHWWSCDNLPQGLRSWIATRNQAGQDHNDHYMTLSNPLFWRRKPLFNPRIPKDIAASAVIWLLENSTDVLVAPAVAAAFPEFQWPSRHLSESLFYFCSFRFVNEFTR